jgi:diphthamide synthase (EF-2-diphthine--ammonia ligase)
VAGLFPLWGRVSRRLAEEFIERGFRAVLCCVDTRALPLDFAGRAFDLALLHDLPAGVDPCGENGELHTFVWDGPGFTRPVGFAVGERVLRDGRFGYVDLLPV